MKTAIVSVNEKHWLVTAMEVIRAGGVVAFPTDTVYGIGADPFQAEAVARLYQAKGRPVDKAIPILLGSSEDLVTVAQKFPDWAYALMDTFWPGALTLVLSKLPSIPSIVSSTDTLGVRMPDHPVALELMQAAGPLAVTSANLSGAVEATEPSQVYSELGDKIELVVDGGVSPGGRPSTVLDCTAYPPELLREGPVTLEQVHFVLDNV